MTATVAIECAGHPREMGEAQGRILRAEVRALTRRAGPFGGRWPLPGFSPYASGSVRGRGAGRELIRHFTHLAERIDGLARASGRPVDELFALQLRAARGDEACGPTPREFGIALGIDEVGGARLEVSLPASVSGGGPWVLRRSRPEVGFRSLELTLPWLVSALAGVNESGLCVGIALASAGEAVVGTAAPALLLVQECLQRFEQIDSALDWCRERPTCGDATILLGDSNGRLAAVRVEREDRRSVPVREGVLIVAGDTSEAASLAPLSVRVKGGSLESANVFAGFTRFRSEREDVSLRLRVDTPSRRIALWTTEGECSELAFAAPG